MSLWSGVGVLRGHLAGEILDVHFMENFPMVATVYCDDVTSTPVTKVYVSPDTDPNIELTLN